ncbi:MAG: carboxypeptidase-like regulatory domain-containing protein [Bacteroidia bacterium]
MRFIRFFILLAVIGSQVSTGFAGNDNNETINLQGVVLDESGEPLAGVAIRVQGYPSTIYTDLEGNFTVHLPKGMKLNATVSTISYKEKQVELNAQSAQKGHALEISLEPNGSF